MSNYVPLPVVRRYPVSSDPERAAYEAELLAEIGYEGPPTSVYHWGNSRKARQSREWRAEHKRKALEKAEALREQKKLGEEDMSSPQITGNPNPILGQWPGADQLYDLSGADVVVQRRSPLELSLIHI